MKTERLHYDDPLRLEATATVVAHAAWRGEPSVILDRTVFYPESGGQLGDRGQLEDADVLDVQLDEAGRVHHLLRGPAPAVGATVRGRVDEARRREHMALHTAQHALSRAVLDALGAVTVSSRLGASACTIDVDVDGLDLDALRPVEERVNELVDRDVPVRQYFPDADELARLSLRKPPPDAERVRVVAIEGWDTTPCGGTHVTHSAQIQLVWIQSVERYKRGSRITFAAGPRARRALREESDALRALAGRLRCAPPEVGDVVAGLERKRSEAREEAGQLRAALADRWAQALGAEGDVVAALEGADVALLELVAKRLATHDRLIALAAPSPEGTAVLLTRGPDASVDCGALMKAVARVSGGRGGGRPARAQGRLPAGVDLAGVDLAALVRHGRAATDRG